MPLAIECVAISTLIFKLVRNMHVIFMMIMFSRDSLPGISLVLYNKLSYFP